MVSYVAFFFAGIFLCLFTGINVNWAMLLGCILFTGMAVQQKTPLRQILKAAWHSTWKSRGAVITYLIIGAMIGLWRSSGTLALCLYASIHFLSPRWFVLLSFLLCAVISFAVGTTYGVTGTIGVVLITIARAGGVDPSVAAGAILCGVFVSNRCSPLAACPLLVAESTGTDIYRNVKNLLKSGILPFLMTTVFFAAISPSHALLGIDDSVCSLLKDSFSLGWPTVIPLIAAVLLALCRLDVRWVTGISAVQALLVSLFYQHQDCREILHTALLGYTPHDEALLQLLGGGGMKSMSDLAVLVILAAWLEGIVCCTELLSRLKILVEKMAVRFGLLATTTIISSLLGMIFCSQTMMIVFCRQLLIECYHQQGASMEELASDLSNSGVIWTSLMPWNMIFNAPAGMLFVGPEVLPWCFLQFVTPICYMLTKRLFFPHNNGAERFPSA